MNRKANAIRSAALPPCHPSAFFYLGPRKTIPVRHLLFLLLCLPGIAPAQSYWQQQADHEIHVRLDDAAHQLHAFQTVTYSNNSPDTLRHIWFHLWPNAYQRGTALDRQMREDGDVSLFYSKLQDRGFIDSLDWKADGQPIASTPHPQHTDIVQLVLNSPLLPGETIRISTPFRVQIPKGIFSRLGHLGQAYQVTQWFPKPAVYDPKGWHAMPYLGQGEFYSEFGTYDVHITLPKNYVVGATGDLVNGDAELQWLDEKARITAATDSFNTRDLRFPPSDPQTKTLHFHQERVHDFAWFADKRYHVLKGEVALPSGRKVTTWAMFTNNEAPLWQRSIEYLNDATRFYSEKVGEYPYNHVTAVDGVLSEGGGMEYPNITIIGESGNAYSLEETIMHEVGHNWFYGLLASNERQHPWMDEGMNSFIESRYMHWKYPGLKLRESLFSGGLYRFGLRLLGAYHLEHRDLGMLAYRMSVRANTDQPIETPSAAFSSTNYGTIAYMKSAVVLNYLMQYLGEEKMDTLMHRYFREWQYRHPYPEDFRKVAMEVTGDSLSWFFDDVVGSRKKMDYAAKYTRLQGDSVQVRIRNRGGIEAPFPITVLREDSVQSVTWSEGHRGAQWVTVPCDSCDRVMIDAHRTMPDPDLKNNTFLVRGFGKSRHPHRIQPLVFLESDMRYRVAFAPVLGGNKYDGFMLGMAFYNDILPKNRFSFMVMPMYAFGSKGLTGMADIHYTIHTLRGPQVRFRIQGQRFDLPLSPNSRYLPGNIIRPEVSLTFGPRNRRLNMTHHLRLRGSHFIRENNARDQIVIPQLTYEFRQEFKPHSTRITLDYQQLERDAKLSLEAVYGFAYRRSRGLRARLFVGGIIGSGSNPIYNLRMSSHRGYQDYLYEGAYMGRFETSGFFSQQMIEADGGFKTYMNIGQSNEWLMALNLSSTLYRKIPVELFFSIGLSSNTGTAFPESELFIVEFGASINVIPDVLAVHFPIALSSDLQQNAEFLTTSYWERIRFTFNINALKPRQRVQGLFR